MDSNEIITRHLSRGLSLINFIFMQTSQHSCQNNQKRFLSIGRRMVAGKAGLLNEASHPSVREINIHKKI